VILAAFCQGYRIELETADAAEAERARHERARYGYAAGSWSWPCSVTTPSGVEGGARFSVEDESPRLLLVGTAIPCGLPEELLQGLTRALEDEARRALPALMRANTNDAHEAWFVLEDILEYAECRVCGAGKAHEISGAGCGGCGARARAEVSHAAQ
jgi:hypothetical protein